MSLSRSAPGLALVAGICLAAGPSRAETATYELVFESTWSQATHPVDFPPNPHFSGLIGGTHTGLVSFWDEGQLASTGIRNVAEIGSKVVLTQEVQAAIGAGTADAVLSGGAIFVSPGTRTMSFEIDDAFPLVTLVSMLAPSPDWFVGVSGLSLRENGDWVQEVVVPLHVYDAGTDSGVSYTSPDQPTVPPVPIFELTTTPFHETNVVGTFTFTRTGVVGVAEGGLAARDPLVALGPNPVRGATRFELAVPAGRRGDLAVYGVRGQRIRTLFLGRSAGGASFVDWNGRDERGTRVAAGVYFVTLRVDGELRDTQRIVVVR